MLTDLCKAMRVLLDVGQAYSSSGGRVYLRCPICQPQEVNQDEYKLTLRPGKDYLVQLHCFRCGDRGDRRRERWVLFETFRRLGLDHKVYTRKYNEEVVQRVWSELGVGGRRGRDTDQLPCDPELLHAVYTDLLDRLELTDQHGRWLTKVGLDADLAYGLGYRSTPEDSGPVAKALFEKWGFRLCVVPGFTNVFTHSTVNLCTRSQAVLTPCRDVAGRVLCLKQRMLDGGKGRHRLLAGGSARPTVLCHCPLGVGGHKWDQLMIAEGERKADIVFQKLGKPVVGVPGTGCVGYLSPLLPEILQSGAVITLALDRDNKPQTQAAQNLLATQLAARGYRVNIAEWDTGKGIDDAVVKGAEIRQVEWKGEGQGVNHTLSSNNTLHIDSRPSGPLKDSDIIPYIESHGPVLRSKLPLRHRNQEVLISKWITQGKLRVKSKGREGQLLEAVGEQSKGSHKSACDQVK